MAKQKKFQNHVFQNRLFPVLPVGTYSLEKQYWLKSGDSAKCQLQAWDTAGDRQLAFPATKAKSPI